MTGDPLQNPTAHTEAPLEGWKAIAEAIGRGEDAASDLAHREFDPLPVYVYLREVVAWPSAIREWRARQLLPINVMRRMRDIGPKREAARAARAGVKRQA